MSNRYTISAGESRIINARVVELRAGQPVVRIGGVEVRPLVPQNVAVNLLAEGDWVTLCKPEDSSRWIVVADLTGTVPHKGEGGGRSQPILSAGSITGHPGVGQSTDFVIRNDSGGSFRFDPGFPIGTITFPMRGEVTSGSARVIPPFIVGTSLRIITGTSPYGVVARLFGGSNPGSAIILDVHKNGSSIFDQSGGTDNRPTIGTGATVDYVAMDPYRVTGGTRYGDTVDLDADDYLEVFLDSGTIPTNYDLTLAIRVTP